MKTATSRFVIVAAIAALVVLGGSTAAWAEVAPLPCPTSPSFTPDFGFQNCLTLNGTLNGVHNTAYPSFQVTNPTNTVKTVLRLTPNQTVWAGSAWFTVKQPMANGFSTTFTFLIKDHANSTLCGGTDSPCPADGIAFVIQNSGATALGPDGCGIGFGANTDCTGTNGIIKSLAVEFDTFNNDDTDNNHANHVAIQSCAAGAANSTRANGDCNHGDYILSSSLADGTVHTATISFTPQTTCAGSSCPGTLDVVLDGTDLFPNGVSIDLSPALDLNDNNNSALVGFTAATGGAFDNQDILSWTFSPSQTQQVTTDLATYSFQGGFNPNGTGGFDYAAQLAAGSQEVVVTPILKTQAECNTLVQKTFSGAQCIVYHNPDGANGDFAVLFEISCPLLPNSKCTQTDSTTTFDAELGTNFNFDLGHNPGFNLNSPFPGWLKGEGPIDDHACTPNADGSLFQSNQIDSFVILGDDPPAKTKGGSGGTGSCWVATYGQHDEVPPVITISSPTPTNYTLGQQVPATFACIDPSSSNLPEDSNHKTGPYLTLVPGSCTPSPAPVNGFVDTSTLGPHTFTVTATDTGLNQGSNSVNYNVVAPATDLAILKLGNLVARTGGKISYVIGVGDLGPSNGFGVTVSDTLPADTSLVSVSGQNVSCSVVNKKLTCTTTPISCSGGATVSCTVGTIMPLSLSSLNGATITVTVQLGPSWTAGKTVKNTASVTALGTDPKMNNNSSTATTLVTR